MPEISIIVPVYNTEFYLSECIDSIIAQTYSDWELLLIDDGSSDNSPAICDQYAAKDPRIRVFHKTNGGVSSARNLGLDNACGNWITFIDSDDWVDKSYLMELYSNVKENNADITFCDFKLCFPDGHEELYKTHRWSDNRDLDISRYFYAKWICSVASIIRKDILKKHNIKFPLNISMYEDVFTMFRLTFLAPKLVNIELPLYYYRQNSNSVCHNFKIEHFFQQLKVLEYLEDFFNSKQKCYNREISHLRLACCHFMILDPKYFKMYNDLNHKSRHFIFSCPRYNKKLKLMAWFLTHRLQALTFSIVQLRKILGR